MIISTFTNATLITDKLLPKFKKYISLVAISLDSLNDEHNALIKRQKSELVINNIKKLQKFNVSVVISATITKINYYDIKELVQFAKKNGITEIKINDFVTNGRARDNLDYIKLNKSLLDIVDDLKQIITDTFREKISENHKFRCDCSDNDLFINYKGELYPCVELSYISKDFCLGNIVRYNFDDLIKLNRNFYKQIKNTDYCGYSCISSTHFSACLNRDNCPKSLSHYMRLAKYKP